MKLRIENLAKSFGDTQAVKNIAFEVNSGEVVGLLGPNGAGKTTTMRMMTGYISPDAGIVSYNGEPPGVDYRRHLGYLPENNPLYGDMYIREYLEFIASIYSLPGKNSAIDKVIARTGLTPQAGKKIRELSKGYRQRVGLAQAIIHDPHILILDEPTSGLDPNQLIDIRSLIKELGTTKAIVLSTHILQEVKAVCDRVVILNQGEIVADTEVTALGTDVEDQSRVFVHFSKPIDVENFKKYTGAERIEEVNPNEYLVTAAAIDIREKIFDYAVGERVKILSMYYQQKDIDQIFKAITAK